ncbi:MAG: flagellar biosynthetic protein FliR [Deltaproteobacteria bacterium]|nr:flagellar biosynthetic protein FliR [Deltaproteobacteria bacterium]
MLYPVFNHLGTFFFVFIRIISILMAVPFFGSRIVPMPIKMGLALMLGVIIAPILGITVAIPDTLAGLIIAAAREVIMGAAIGFIVRLVFSAFEMAGQVAGMQMGYAVANVIDPHNNSQISVLSQVYNIMGILLFFSLNVHIVFISAIKESFEIVPPYGFTITKGMMHGFLGMTWEMFRIAVKLAAPITVSILITNIAMGVMSRTVPQLNVFILGFPVTIILGLIVMLFSLPFIISIISNSYIDLSHNLIDLLKMGGRGG